MDASFATCTVHIVGLGLMGGSLAMALRGKVGRLTAEDIAPEVIEDATARGIINGPGTVAEAGCGGAGRAHHT